MLVLLGAGGYVGQAFARELLRRQQPFIPLTRKAIDYSQFNLLFDYLRKIRPDFVINAAGYTGHPDEAGCESAREQTLSANALLPQTVARACLMTHTPWGHVSSGQIYIGAKVLRNGHWEIEEDLHRPELRELLAEHPERLYGFSELDEPNYSFRCGSFSFYSGTKALAEEAVRDRGQCYLWRAGAPFNHSQEPRNYLCRLQRTHQICDGIQSFSHVDDFARACLTLWEDRVPFGIYNVTNPGYLTAQQVVRMIQRILKPTRRFEFWNAGPELHEFNRSTQHPHSVLASTKLESVGVEMRPVEAAMEDALRHWEPAGSSAEAVLG